MTPDEPIVAVDSAMHGLRARIDALDARLIALLAERSALIDEAARIKAREGLPARIDSRVEEVAANARRLARAQGFDADLAESLWRLMMEHFIAQEDRLLAAGRKP
ncbi:isochorismate pyruvate lyase [Paracoccus halophilus]|uniref:chorismate mutase n=1 Tax=Paracoccus halophilus TaxID=376733 RepID=A0A099F9G3_9RHOB|nr:chorismate mutase [Paracoccus halophilus]KGJ06727.1 chorismate mutase [Paracoccus halophilus]SFA41962.1 isochorismate pyruvate lyase [Paracoccus halophilus]